MQEAERCMCFSESLESFSVRSWSGRDEFSSWGKAQEEQQKYYAWWYFEVSIVTDFIRGA